jgi:hypothetical protein
MARHPYVVAHKGILYVQVECSGIREDVYGSDLEPHYFPDLFGNEPSYLRVSEVIAWHEREQRVWRRMADEAGAEGEDDDTWFPVIQPAGGGKSKLYRRVPAGMRGAASWHALCLRSLRMLELPEPMPPAKK